MGLAGTRAHDGVADDARALHRDAAQVGHAQAIVENTFGPGKLVGRTLDADDFGDIRIAHGANGEFTGMSELVCSSGHS